MTDTELKDIIKETARQTAMELKQNGMLILAEEISKNQATKLKGMSRRKIDKYVRMKLIKPRIEGSRIYFKVKDVEKLMNGKL